MAKPPPPTPPAAAAAAATTADPIFISTATLQTLLTPKTLIAHLAATLPAATISLTTPPRHSVATSTTSTLLLMPSFSTSPSLPYTGIKLVTHHPLLSPSIHAAFVLFSSLSGQTLALMDATHLTLARTAAVSALASLYLSKPTSETLLMIGSGALAPHLIRSHVSSRPSLKRVLIWNRTADRAARLVTLLRSEGGFEGVAIEECESLDEAVRVGDIVSCATNSEVGLVKGALLKEGAHLDLVGSFKETMRECDDEAMRRGRVFVDNVVALDEAGELVGALARGVVEREGVGTLVELIKGVKSGRLDEKEITVFKSVGSAGVDVLAAQLAYETYMKGMTEKQQHDDDACGSLETQGE